MDTKRLVGMVMLFGACLFGILLSTAFFSTQDTDEIPYWLKGLRATGKVLEMSKDRISIKLDTEKEMTFQIDAHTRISLMGNTQLTAGALVKITYKSFTDPATPPLARWIKQLPETGKSIEGGTGASPSPGATSTPGPEVTASPGTGATLSPEQGVTASPSPGADATPEPGSTASPAPVTGTTTLPGATPSPEKKSGTGGSTGI